MPQWLLRTSFPLPLRAGSHFSFQTVKGLGLLLLVFGRIFLKGIYLQQVGLCGLFLEVYLAGGEFIKKRWLWPQECAAGGAQAPTAGAEQLKTGGGNSRFLRNWGGGGQNILLKNIGHIDKSLLTKY